MVKLNISIKKCVCEFGRIQLLDAAVALMESPCIYIRTHSHITAAIKNSNKKNLFFCKLNKSKFVT